MAGLNHPENAFTKEIKHARERGGSHGPRNAHATLGVNSLSHGFPYAFPAELPPPEPIAMSIDFRRAAR